MHFNVVFELTNLDCLIDKREVEKFVRNYFKKEDGKGGSRPSSRSSATSE
jgi:hypothetical protein